MQKDQKTIDFINKYENKFGKFYIFDKTIFTGSKNKIIVTCPIHGDFDIRANIFMFGQGCKQCGIAKNKKQQTKTTEQFVKESIEKHGDYYDYSKTVYISSKEKVIITCPVHGDFEQIANNHLQGQQCRKCVDSNKRKTTEQFIIDANKIHHNKYDYSKTVYVHSEEKVIITCLIHGDFEQEPYRHLQSGCPKCSLIKKSLDKFKTTEQWITEAKLIHGDKYDYSKSLYIHSEDKILIGCKKHGDFEQLAYKHIQGYGCPKCSNSISKGEMEIVEFLKEIGIENIKTNVRNIISNELDIYLPEYNLSIEFNGLYWHSDAYKNDDYHLRKTDECLNKGIKLIHIFEDEWLYKKDIVKSRLINLLGKIKTGYKIFARNCFIKEIDTEQARKFTERNHLQGFTGAKIHIGLFFKQNDKEYMVSYMSFGSLRKNLGNTHTDDNEYELLRFCSVINYSVVGGANKLLKYFERKYKPHYIISYADRRWSNGNVYEKLNFTLSHKSKPNYFYVNGLKRENRFSYRKDILISKYGCSPEDTERNFTSKNLLLNRIYDSGNLVYEKILTTKT